MFENDYTKSILKWVFGWFDSLGGLMKATKLGF